MKLVRLTLGDGYSDVTKEGTITLIGEGNIMSFKLTEDQTARLVGVAMGMVPEIFTAVRASVDDAEASILALPAPTPFEDILS